MTNFAENDAPDALPPGLCACSDGTIHWHPDQWMTTDGRGNIIPSAETSEAQR